MIRPDHIQEKHWQEWLESGVDPSIIALNVRSVSDLDVDPYAREVTAPIAELLNWRYVRFGQQVKENLRGWIVQGIDPATAKTMEWLRFKPDSDTPVFDRKKDEAAKYLSPSGVSSRATFLRVSRETWQKVSDRCGVPISPSDTDFWTWVRNVKVDLTLAEGEKKAGCLLSMGYAAIALPGITGGVRTKNPDGTPCIPHLIPELQMFAQPGRPWTICFDYETKPKTINAVNREIEKLKIQLTKARCEVRIATLPGPEKGVDDFVMAQGEDAYHQVYAAAAKFEQWQVQRFTRLSQPAALTLNQRYLGKLDIPENAKLIGIKSPKGTGKTESFVDIAAAAMAVGQRVLLLTHRVQLGQALCDRIGLPYVTELKTSEEGWLLGYGLCIDSLYPESQSRFDADYWHGALVIIDESEQVIWHLLDAKTEVAKRRIPILSQLKRLLVNTFESDRGRVILSDADLSDLSFEFIWGLSGKDVKPWIALNNYQTDTPWEISHYSQKSPEQWFAALNGAIADGERVFVSTQAQSIKGRWSTCSLEAHMRRRYPDKRILRIDSQSIADPGHEAYACTSKLNDILPNYDIVIASPSIETGVSIDIRGHFTSVWACLNGVTPENSARQALARLREPVPRHIWATRYGLGRIANGSSSAKEILRAEQEVARNAAKLMQIFNFDEELAAAFGPALLVWAKMAARINAGVINYRDSVLSGLTAEGHIISEGRPNGGAKALLEEITAVRDEEYEKFREATATAEDITASEYEKLKGKKTKTREEYHKERKFSIRQRYQVEVTPELVEKDDKGWYPQLRLQYFLTFGRQFLQEHDRQALEQVNQSSGPWLPTMNRSQLITRIAIMEVLDIKRFINPDAEFNGGTKALNYQNAHPDLLHLWELVKNPSYRWQIKNHLGVMLSESMSPIQIVQTLLGKLGLKLICDRQQGSKGQRERVYCYIAPKDGRDEILQGWYTRDEVTRNQSEMHTPGIYNNKLEQVGGAA